MGASIDPSDARKITTSEGQSYGLFFALAANDRKAFDLLLAWTRDNACRGDLTQHLPAWLWGKRTTKPGRLSTLTPRLMPISEFWSLLEAGRLWKNPDYTRTGKALLTRIASE